MSDKVCIGIVRGMSLYNRELNKSGVVLDASNPESVKVMTASGGDYWNPAHCDVMEDYDD